MVAIAKLYASNFRDCPYILSRSSLSCLLLQLLRFQPCYQHLVVGHAIRLGLIERRLQQQLSYRLRAQEAFLTRVQFLPQLIKFSVSNFSRGGNLQFLTRVVGGSVGSHSGTWIAQSKPEGRPAHPERSGYNFRRRNGVCLE
jgi:hypothetical protein